MNKSARTRQHIIETTAPVFNIYGYEGTSLAMLQEVTGLTKGSLYGNFRDKEEIASEAFHHAMRQVRRFFNERIEKQKTPKQKLLTFLKVFAEHVFDSPVPGGCPLLNNAVEADDHHITLKKAVAREIESTIEFLVSLLDEGRRVGEFQRTTKSREVAFAIFASIEGAMMISRVSSSAEAMKVVLKYCKSIIEEISIKEKA